MTLSKSAITQAFAQFKEAPAPVVSPVPVTETVTAAGEPKKVTARLNYTEVGVCPYCAKPMDKSKACEQTVYICRDDRFVSPLPNEE